MKYFVYVLINKEKKLYKGVTADLEKRLKYHNDGKSRWTRSRGPWELVYKEEFNNKSKALKREKFLKSGKGREYLKKITSGYGADG